MIKVKLETYTNNPIWTVANASAVCYNTKIKDQNHAYKIIRDRIKDGHDSVLEHVSFTFHISGISRNESHQEVRHRISSISQKSQRYVDEEGFEYVIPPDIEKDPVLKQTFKDHMFASNWIYKHFREQGINKEDARYLLPSACTTILVHTFNVRSLRNFLNLRLAKQAQWEIREVAWLMVKCLTDIGCLVFFEDIVLKYLREKPIIRSLKFYQAKKPSKVCEMVYCDDIGTYLTTKDNMDGTSLYCSIYGTMILMEC